MRAALARIVAFYRRVRFLLSLRRLEAWIDAQVGGLSGDWPDDSRPAEERRDV